MFSFFEEADYYILLCFITTVSCVNKANDKFKTSSLTKNLMVSILTDSGNKCMLRM